MTPTTGVDTGAPLPVDGIAGPVRVPVDSPGIGAEGASGAAGGAVRGLVGSLVMAAVLAALYLTSRYSYLLFHTLIELFTVVVAAGIFVIAWNARRFLRNNYLLFAGIGALFIGFIDLFHTLAYQGTSVFPGNTADLATQFWIAGRSLEAAVLVLAAFTPGRRLRVGVVLTGMTLVTGLLVVSIFAGAFPTCFVEGVGLTRFKVVAEYGIAGGFVAAAGLLAWKREAFAPPVLRLLLGFLALSAAAELAFTAYISVYGGANMVGHMLRLVAAFLLYKAIIETGLVKPHQILLRELKLSELRLQEYAADLEAKNEALRRLTADLAEHNQDLDAFARTVAHDLKSPLATIVTGVQLIRTIDDLPREKAALVLERICATAATLARIVDNLLLLARVRKEEAPREPVDMERIVAAVRDRLEQLIQEHEAEVTIAAELPAALGFAPWIEEVWANYLTNALQHGGPRPRIELGADVIDGGTVRYWVRDHGPGLPAELQAQLFEPFRHFGNGGTGLGLSIVARIVEKLGGAVGVVSDVGRGSLFYFTLPAATAAPAATPGAVR